MNKQQLASKIWAGANALRGKVSADAYKDYMLGFVFYKYISYKEERYLKEKLYFSKEEIKNLTEEDITTVEDCKKHLGYFIAGNNLFSSWILSKKEFQIKDVRIALNAFDKNIGPNYKKVYSKIFDTLSKGLDSLGAGDPERTKAARKLLELIVEIPTDGSQDYDVLGFIYEFLLKNFAANAGKAGEFYTPHEASLLMSEIVAEHLKNKNEISIYDPTSGSGSLLINIGQTIAKHMEEKNKIKYYAQELIENTYNLTRMNLLMRDILPSNIVVRNNDTLKDDWPFFDDNDKERTYEFVSVDAAISNPPYSQSWDTTGMNTDPRFSEYGIAPKSKADYAFLLHSLYHLKPDGIMTIVLPHGVLFRGGEEKNIRQKLIDKDNIDTIIGLPSNMFFGTGIPTIIMVLKKNRTNNDVLIIDASKGFIKDGNKNKLREKDIKKILDTIFNRVDIDKYSKVVSKEEIIDNDYNLNISRYVDSSIPEDYVDIYGSMFGGIPNEEINSLEEYWDAFPTLKSQIFKKSDIPYSEVIQANIEHVVYNNNDVKEYIKNYKNTFNDLKDYLKQELINKNQTLNIYREKEIIMEKIREKFNKIKLVDFYDAYQIFNDNWNSILLDLEILQKDGLKALNIVDPDMKYKKNKQKELEEYQDGWVGRILNYELIQDEFFKKDKESLEELNNELLDLDNQKKEFLDSIDVNDKINILKEDSEDIDTKKLKTIISKINKEVKNGAEFEEGSYEEIILNISNINDKMKKCKNEIKKIKTKLEDDTKYKIETIGTDEALKLLEKKWIIPLCNEIEKLPEKMLNEFLKSIKYLENKYKESFCDLDIEIKNTENELSKMLDELTGNEFDKEGLEKFKSLLGGE